MGIWFKYVIEVPYEFEEGFRKFYEYRILMNSKRASGYSIKKYIYIYIYICVCVCIYIYIYILIAEPEIVGHDP